MTSNQWIEQLAFLASIIKPSLKEHTLAMGAVRHQYKVYTGTWRAAPAAATNSTTSHAPSISRSTLFGNSSDSRVSGAANNVGKQTADDDSTAPTPPS